MPAESTKNKKPVTDDNGVIDNGATETKVSMGDNQCERGNWLVPLFLATSNDSLEIT